MRAVFAAEHERLLTLPDNPFPTDERLTVSAGKQPYIRFDRNDYTVPHTRVRRELSVLASLSEVRVLDGHEVIASHPRSFDHGAQIEDPSHIAALVGQKHAARAHRGIDRLAAAVPNSHALMTEAAARGEPLGALTTALLRLLDAYGVAELDAAISDALAHGVPHPHAVRLALERRRELRGAPPPLALPLTAAVRARDPVVRTHPLSSYDDLMPKETTP